MKTGSYRRSNWQENGGKRGDREVIQAISGKGLPQPPHRVGQALGPADQDVTPVVLLQLHVLGRDAVVVAAAVEDDVVYFAGGADVGRAAQVPEA
jgi:hypothetical protein